MRATFRSTRHIECITCTRSIHSPENVFKIHSSFVLPTAEILFLSLHSQGIVHMNPWVTKSKAKWSPKAMGVKVLVFTFKNAGT